jgi:hypothetical protein
MSRDQLLAEILREVRHEATRRRIEALPDEALRALHAELQATKLGFERHGRLAHLAEVEGLA